MVNNQARALLVNTNVGPVLAVNISRGSDLLRKRTVSGPSGMGHWRKDTHTSIREKGLDSWPPRCFSWNGGGSLFVTGTLHVLNALRTPLSMLGHGLACLELMGIRPKGEVISSQGIGWKASHLASHGMDAQTVSSPRGPGCRTFDTVGSPRPCETARKHWF